MSTTALGRAKAIRKYCISCCGGLVGEVRKCAITDCPLHGFRFGPGRKGHRSESDAEIVAPGAQNEKNSAKVR
jgi:hypothetical protein